MSDVILTLIKSATQATSPVADSAALPANVGDADRYVEVGQIRRYDYDDVIATGSVTLSSRHLIALDLGTALALTILAAPTVGDELEIIRDGSGVITHTVVLSGSVTWDGTNTTASFDTDDDYLRVIAVSTTRWRIVGNVGVTLSA